MAPVPRPTEPQGVLALAPLPQAGGGGSGSFLVRADDGRRYWCKTLNNLQHERVPLNEQIVARLGLLIGAPVCEPQLVYMPPDLVGHTFRPGRQIEEGWAHGSLAVEPAVETHDLARRATDDNARRHAGIYALHDWACGQDAQWLMVGAEYEFHSHDHGHYLPDGPAWTVASLQRVADAAYPLGFPATDLDGTELTRLADRLTDVTEEEVVSCAANIPMEWPVQDDELEALVDFLYSRRSPCADRLRAMVGAV